MTIYGTPPFEPDDVVVQAPGVPSAESILDRYIQAAGGGQRLAGLTSFVGKGTSVGFGGFGGGGAVEIVAKGAGQARDDHRVQGRNGSRRSDQDLRRQYRLGENAAQRAGRVSVERAAIWMGRDSTRSCRFQGRSSRFSRI